MSLLASVMVWADDREHPNSWSVFFAASISNRVHMDTSSVWCSVRFPPLALRASFRTLWLDTITMCVRYAWCTACKDHKLNPTIPSLAFTKMFSITCLQIIVFHHLVHWLSSSWFTLYIDRSVVCDYVGYVPRVISDQVGQKTNALRCIIFHPSSNEPWEPKLPVPDDLGTIFPANSLPEINIEVTEVNKSPVKWVNRVSSLHRHHCRFDDHVCCIT